MSIIAIANQKGGCGKTTTAINLSSSLALQGQRVLLVDLDPQAHASLGLNIESQDSIYHVISKLAPRKLKIEDIIVRIENHFDLVPSNILVGTLEQELADEIGRELKLTEAFNSIKDNYDYILIDCPPNLGFLTINALRASSRVIIPMETSKFSLQGVERLMEIVDLIKTRLNHLLNCKVLITMFDSRLRHSFSMMTKIKEKFADILMDTIVHVNVKLKESVLAGQTVSTFDKYCRGAKDYFGVAREVLRSDNKPDFEKLSPRMSSLVKQKSRGLLPTTFDLKNPEAQSVYITGSFNDWSLDESYRLKRENGHWSLTLPLPPGVHRYRFIIDGHWQEDPENPQKEQNPFGDINSLVEVR